MPVAVEEEVKSGVNTKYVVDVVVDLITKISSSPVVYFQRDGSFYVASAQGFGRVTPGLNIYTEELVDCERKTVLIDGTTSIVTWVGEEHNQRPKYSKGEQERLKPIVFGPDDNGFTLEDVTKAAQELANLSDDKMIRIVSHGSRYHSHKHGYAADGIDVWVRDASMMDRATFLELLRKQEEKTYARLQEIAEFNPQGKGVNKKGVEEQKQRMYKEALGRVPQGVLITPHLLAVLPIYGRMHLHRSEPDSWNNTTRFEMNPDRRFGTEVDTYRENPFNIYVTLNAHNLRANNAQTFDETQRNLTGNITRESGIVAATMKDLEILLERINDAHNKICAEDIKWSKDIRKRRE